MPKCLSLEYSQFAYRDLVPRLLLTTHLLQPFLEEKGLSIFVAWELQIKKSGSHTECQGSQHHFIPVPRCVWVSIALSLVNFPARVENSNGKER